MAEKYPNANITAVSNSSSQREFILRTADERGVAKNLQVITYDMNDFDTEQSFDRVVSIEMFEHMRNYETLLRRISSWLAEDGKLFVHIFCHKALTYKFQDEGSSDWMSRYFFSGGIMPSNELLSHFQNDLALAKQWSWNGVHYQKTAEAWLANMDSNRTEIMKVLTSTYDQDANRWFNRWRMFYLACSELFGFDGGNEWFVGHYLFENSLAPNGQEAIQAKEIQAREIQAREIQALAKK
jgi:cyclopropane-fatty-acyl-phospholipid synthase